MQVNFLKQNKKISVFLQIMLTAFSTSLQISTWKDMAKSLCSKYATLGAGRGGRADGPSTADNGHQLLKRL